jgi:hypothetical protein
LFGIRVEVGVGLVVALLTAGVIKIRARRKKRAKFNSAEANSSQEEGSGLVTGVTEPEEPSE